VKKSDKLKKAELVRESAMKPVREWEESLGVPKESSFGYILKRTGRQIQEAENAHLKDKGQRSP
jgi:uncharacterized protein YmfQ (DUF2313 family)